MLVREVGYTPFWCRWGLHSYECKDDVTHFLDLVHVHACKRCGRVKLEGRIL